jgi:hypothetical protein
MSKFNKYGLLFLLLFPYILVSIFDMTFGTLSLLMSTIRTPFKLAGNKIIEQANKINTK